MALFTETLALPENSFLILRNLIMEKTGIYFEESKKDMLADKLSGRVIECGFNSFLDYYYLLKYDTESSNEWNRVFDIITVRETYFWREYDHIDALMNHVLPEFVNKNPGGKFRIWSAACATGEEPLSIVMALHKAGWFERTEIEVLASDASNQSVEKAKNGIFRERSLHKLPEDVRKAYFTGTGNQWQIAPEILKRVKFFRLNLNDEKELQALPEQDTIFCRNVFIYFRENTIKAISDRLYDKLANPGFLFVGITESLFRIKSKFDLTEIGKTFVYRKAN